MRNTPATCHKPSSGLIPIVATRSAARFVARAAHHRRGIDLPAFEHGSLYGLEHHDGHTSGRFQPAMRWSTRRIRQRTSVLRLDRSLHHAVHVVSGMLA